VFAQPIFRPSGPKGDRPARGALWRRYFELLVTALKAGAADDPLRTPAPLPDAIPRIMGAWQPPRR
jgi:hypothetical protein